MVTFLLLCTTLLTFLAAGVNAHKRIGFYVIGSEDSTADLKRTFGKDLFTHIPDTAPASVANLVVVDATLEENLELSYAEQHSEGRFNRTDAAVVHTHLQAVADAHRKGYEVMLVVLGEANVTAACNNASTHHSPRVRALSHLRRLIAAAPFEWEAMLLLTESYLTAFQLHHTPDFFVQWHHLFGKPLVYCLHRRGMQTILDRVESWDRPHIPLEALLFHQFLFPFLRAFVATCSPFAAVGLRDPAPCHDHPPCALALFAAQPAPPNHFAHLKILAMKVISPPFQRAAPVVSRDVRSLVAFPHAAWMFHIIMHNSSDQGLWDDTIQQWRATHPAQQITVYFRVSDVLIPKWVLMHEYRAHFLAFDYVMYFDEDLATTGFPFVRLFRDLRTSYTPPPLLAGVPRYTFLKVKEQFWQYDSFYYNLPSTWLDFNACLVKAQPITMVEQYFFVANATFFHWLLETILAPEHLAVVSAIRSCWGPDSLWCEAAKTYGDSSLGCVLFPTPILHLNWGSLRGKVKGNNSISLRHFVDSFPMWGKQLGMDLDHNVSTVLFESVNRCHLP